MWILAQDHPGNTGHASLVIFYTQEQDVGFALHTPHKTCALSVNVHHIIVSIKKDNEGKHWQLNHLTSAVYNANQILPKFVVKLQV